MCYFSHTIAETDILEVAMESSADGNDIEMIATLVSTGQLFGFSVSRDEINSKRPPRKQNKRRDSGAASERLTYCTLSSTEFTRTSTLTVVFECRERCSTPLKMLLERKRIS